MSMRVNAVWPFENCCMVTISRLVLIMVFHFATYLRISLCVRLFLKSAIASQLIHIAPTPLDPVYRPAIACLQLYCYLSRGL